MTGTLATESIQSGPAIELDVAPVDRRLAPAFAMVESGEIDLLSLDVFDTLLFRRVPQPRDVFLLLGRRLRANQAVQESISAEAFALLREEAEMRARDRAWARLRGREITLREIYEVFPRAIARIDRQELAREELRLERELVEPDAAVVRLLRAAQERGIETCLVSDSYLSESELYDLLVGRAFRPPPLRAVFASSSFRQAKAEGLFERVLSRFAVSPRRALHVGDNAAADVEPALRLGMRALHYLRCDAATEAVFEREARSSSGGRELLHDSRGDFGLTAIRARTAFRAPQAIGEDRFWRYGATVLGPVLANFAEWVVERCQAERAGAVHCLMREGQFLGELIARAAARRGLALRARPLWISRLVTARAAIFRASREELMPLFSRRGVGARDTCRELGIDPPPLGARASESELRAATLEEIEARPDLRRRILDASALLRARYARYLRAQIGPDPGCLFLCDLGWGLTIQKRLVEILRHEGFGCAVKGLYLMTQSCVRELLFRGLDCEGYLAHAGLPENEVRWILRTPEILEQACMADCGTLIDVSEAGEPVLSAQLLPAAQLAQARRVQEGMMAFAAQWATAMRAAESHPCASPLLRQRLLGVVFRAVVRPTRGEVEMLAPWRHDENYGSTGTEVIAPGIGHLSAEELLAQPMSSVYWPFGSAVARSESMGEACAALAERAQPTPKRWGAATRVELFVDSGDGFREEEKASAMLDQSDGQLVELSLFCAAAGKMVRAIRLVPTSDAAVLRFAWLRLELFRRSVTDPAVVEARDVDALLREFEAHELLALRGPLLLARGNDPHLLRRLGGEGEGIERVCVRLAIGKVPISMDELLEMRPLRLGRASRAWRWLKRRLRR